MNQIAKFEMPAHVYYGEGALDHLGTLTAELGKKALIVSDEMMEQIGHVDRVVHLLEDEGVTAALYLGANTEPTDDFVADALAIYQSEACDCIVSIGGGSCLDTAKAVAMVATNGGNINEYGMKRRDILAPSVPMVLIPTTAGTGSEATDVTVITNTKENIKMMIKHHAFLPTVALVDPMLTMTAPKHVTAATAIDALCHAMESLISKKAQPMTEIFSTHAIEAIMSNIEEVYRNGDNVQARQEVSLAALQAGIAFSNASVTLVHGMSRPMGAMFHVPHGVSNAMLLPAVLEFTREECEPSLAKVAKVVLQETNGMSQSQLVDELIKEIKRLCHVLEIPNMHDWGIDEKAFEAALDKMATDALDSGSPANNPRVPSHAEVVDLYRTCFRYDFSK